MQADFIVTGFPRSGTSMMMACLKAGGMECHANPAREQMKQSVSDSFYDANPSGVYEPTLDDLASGRRYQVIKVVIPLLDYVHRCDFAFLMMRHPEEIRQSLRACNGGIFTRDFVLHYDRLIRETESRLKGLGATVLRVDYLSVVDDPYSFFEDLPITIPDRRSAAAVVDKRLHRFRRELLVEGL